jgi:hypothetical protein
MINGIEQKTKSEVQREERREKMRMAKEAMLFDTTRHTQILIRARFGLVEEAFECSGVLPILAKTSRYFSTLFREFVESDYKNDIVHNIHLFNHFKIHSDPVAKFAFEYIWKILNGVVPPRMHPTPKRDKPISASALTEAVWIHDLQILVWIKRFADYFQWKNCCMYGGWNCIKH